MPLRWLPPRPGSGDTVWRKEIRSAPPPLSPPPTTLRCVQCDRATDEVCGGSVCRACHKMEPFEDCLMRLDVVKRRIEDESK